MPHSHGPQSNGVRNGGHPKLGSLPRGGSSTSSSSSAGPKHTKKLQSNPSITSQSSKRSKSSSKSNSSQIPTEAQDGEIQLGQEEGEGKKAGLLIINWHGLHEAIKTVKELLPFLNLTL